MEKYIRVLYMQFKQLSNPAWLSLLVSVLLVTAVCTPPPSGSGKTYYVATTGADSNPGTQSQPFLTINKGVSMLQAGDTLYILAGVYNESLAGGAWPSGTSWQQAITIAGYPGQTVTINGRINIDDNWDGSIVSYL